MWQETAPHMHSILQQPSCLDKFTKRGQGRVRSKLDLLIADPHVTPDDADYLQWDTAS